MYVFSVCCPTGGRNLSRKTDHLEGSPQDILGRTWHKVTDMCPAYVHVARVASPRDEESLGCCYLCSFGFFFLGGGGALCEGSAVVRVVHHWALRKKLLLFFRGRQKKKSAEAEATLHFVYSLVCDQRDPRLTLPKAACCQLILTEGPAWDG